MVTGLVLMFAFTSFAVIWLARDVNRSVSNGSAVQAVAFQAARSGAQQLDAGALRDGGAVVIDEPAARAAARRTADEMLANYRLELEDIVVVVAGTEVRVTLTIRDAVTPDGRRVGVGAAEAVGG